MNALQRPFVRHLVCGCLVTLFLLAAGGCATPAGAQTGASEPPAAADLPMPTADEVEQALYKHDLLPWYPRIVDQERGGFHEVFDANWKRVASDDARTLVMQSRLTWTAATAARMDSRHADAFRGYAEHGLRFLRQTMHDSEHGGFFYQRFPDGRAVPAFQDEKHAYGLAFAIYACAAVHRVAPDAGALELAIDTFRWLDRHGYDSEHGGYLQAFARDGTPILRAEDSTRGRPFDCLGTLYGYKDQNTHLHLLEAFTELYRVWPDPHLRSRLEELFVLLRDRIQVPPGCLNLYFTRDWRALPDHDSFGHDVEAAYLLIEAADALGMSDDARTWEVARQLVDHALAYGWDKTNGGFYDKGSAFRAPHDRNKTWWTQAEGLNTLLMMHQRFADETPAYGRQFAMQWHLIARHFFDDARGGWYGYVPESGPMDPNQNKAGHWKGNYHTARALMNVVRRLRAGADAPTRNVEAAAPAPAVAPSVVPGASSAAAPTTRPTVFPGGLEIIVHDGPNPWNHLNFRTDPDAFQFAVVSDNAGGMRPGRFNRAVTALNHLQPQFVVSIGDFINGYRPTAAEINAMWDEFIPQVNRLEPPFFYVPGNHDTASPIMRPIWHERFGRSYYHFRYRSVLFLVLDSMDNPNNTRGLSPRQIDYFRKVLAEGPEPRWTFVLVHRQLWQEKGELRWNEFEALLGDRPYTVFAGHTHQYLKEIRNGREYYTLSVTGGGNMLRGPAYGDFDHIAWVTFSDGKPRVANIEFDHVHGDDVRTTATRTIAWHVDRAVTFEPLRATTDTLSAATVTLRLRNGADLPVRIRGAIQPHPAFSLSQRLVDVELAANVPNNPATQVTGPNAPTIARQMTVELRSDAPVPVQGLQPLVFEGEATYTVPGQPDSVWPIRAVLNFDRQHDIPAAPKAVRVDGRLDEWAQLPHDLSRPMQLATQGGNPWAGPADANARFALAHDDQFLYVAVRVEDDRVLAAADKGDGIQLWLDARPDHQRLGRIGGDKELFKSFMRLTIHPDPADGQPLVREADRMPKGIRTALVRTPAGYDVEIAIPTSYLDQSQKRDSGDWQSVRLNLGILDVDEPAQPATQVWWRPAWRSDEDFPGAGTFTRTPLDEHP